MLFRILKGDSSRISTDVTPFRDGYAYFTPDDAGFYIDSEDNDEQKRIRINPPVEVPDAPGGGTYYGTCSTAAGTVAKAITLTGGDDFSLRAGTVIAVKFSNTNTASNPTFNVNGSGAYPVWWAAAAITTSNLNRAGYASRTYSYVFNGSYWVWQGGIDTTYSNAALGHGYGTCSTAAGTAAKVVSLSSYSLVAGGFVAVQFANAITVANPTMNINSKGAKAIYYKGAALTDTTLIQAGDTCLFVYNGSYYHLLTIDRAVEKADKPEKVSIVLSASGWSGNAQTVTASGVLADETKQLVLPVPAEASRTAYYEAGILCTGHAANSLTFTAQTAPTVDLTVYVVLTELA